MTADERPGDAGRPTADPGHGLPVLLSSFVGRRAELAELAEIVRRHELVTVTGAGGVGKTRLAHRLAGDVAIEHPGGVWWVDLAAAASPDGAVESLLRVFETSAAPGRDPVDAVIARLSGMAGPCLVVVDNAEHQLAVVDEHVVPLAAHGSVRLLITSREPLGASGEYVWRAASMAQPDGPVTREQAWSCDATRLFIERALAVRHNLVLDDDAAALVARICRRLDGIPLAIELAAARARGMTLAAIDEALSTSFRLLSGHGRTSASRQGTVDASIRWSHDLLDPFEQAIFRRLSVMAGPVDLDAVEAVATDGAVERMGVLDVLLRLIDKSLVEFDAVAGRYRMLEATRQFALARLHDHDEVVGARRRHADHYRRLAGAPGTFGAFLRLGTLAPDVDEVLAAFDWLTFDDPDGADRLLADVALTVFGLGRWTDLDRACDWLVADRERRPPWIRAVAHAAVVAPLIGRDDVQRAFAAAVADGAGRDDPEVAALLEASEAYGDIVAGTVGRAREVFDRAVAHGWAVPAFVTGTAVVVVYAAEGALDDVAAVAAAVAGQGLDRETLLSRSSIGPAVHRSAVLRGDLAEARRLLRSPSGAWSMMSTMWAAAAAELGVLTGDTDLIRLARSLCVVDDTPGSRELGLIVTWAERIAAGDLDAARAAAHEASAARFHGIGLQGADALLSTLAALGRWAELEEAALALEGRAAGVGPWPRAVVAVSRGWVALAAGDRQAAEQQAHDALEASGELGLVSVRGLELLAALLAASGSTTRAARLAGAVHAARQRWGWRGELRPAPASALLDDLPSSSPEAWAEGCGLQVPAAVELARRSRGPRNRPVFGPGAWTSTERLVAELCLTGLSNEEIATQLLMSVRTVKTHLGRVYAKVGVQRRAELISRFGGPGRPAS